MRVFAAAVAVSLGFGAVPGCGGNVIVVDGIEVYESYWQDATHELERRVTFDLACPSNGVQFSLLKRTGRYPTEVGVAGCGKRGTYVRTVAPRGFDPGLGPWVLNADGGSAAAVRTPQPPPPLIPPPHTP